MLTPILFDCPGPNVNFLMPKLIVSIDCLGSSSNVPPHEGASIKDDGSLTQRDYLAIGICAGFLVMLYIFAMVVFIVMKRKQSKDRRLREQFLQLPAPEGIGFKSSRILGLDEQYLSDLARYHQCRGGGCPQQPGANMDNDNAGWSLSSKWRNGKRSLRQVTENKLKLNIWNELLALTETHLVICRT